MPSFGKRSLDTLAQAHPDLQRVAREAIKTFDFTVICGYRGKIEQDLAFRTGASKAKFGQSAHNFRPSIAIDIVPYPLNWKDAKAFEAMGRNFMAAAKRLGVPVRWGADWNGNGNLKDETFVDSPHFELNPWRDYR